MFCDRLQVTKVLKTKFEIAAVKKNNLWMTFRKTGEVLHKNI